MHEEQEIQWEKWKSLNPRIRNFNHLFSSSFQSIYIKIEKMCHNVFFQLCKSLSFSCILEIVIFLCRALYLKAKLFFFSDLGFSPLLLTSPISLFASATFLFMVHCVLCEVLLQKGKFYWTSAHCVGQYRVMWVAIFWICSLEPWLYFWG